MGLLDLPLKYSQFVGFVHGSLCFMVNRLQMCYVVSSARHYAQQIFISIDYRSKIKVTTTKGVHFIEFVTTYTTSQQIYRQTPRYRCRRRAAATTTTAAPLLFILLLLLLFLLLLFVPCVGE